MEKRGEVAKARGRGKQWEEDGEDMEVREMGMHENNSPKTQPIWRLGMPLGGYRPVIHPLSYIFRKLFSGTTMPSQMVPLS